MNEIFGSGEHVDKSPFNSGVANSSGASQVPQENHVDGGWGCGGETLVSHPSHGSSEGAATTEPWKTILQESRSSVAKIHISNRNLNFYVKSPELQCRRLKGKAAVNKYTSKYRPLRGWRAGRREGGGPAVLHLIIQGPALPPSCSATPPGIVLSGMTSAATRACLCASGCLQLRTPAKSLAVGGSLPTARPAGGRQVLAQGYLGSAALCSAGDTTPRERVCFRNTVC